MSLPLKKNPKLSEFPNINDKYKQLASHSHNESTDNLAWYSKLLGKKGIKFHDVYDRPLTTPDGVRYAEKVNEMVLHPGTERYILGINQPKINLLFDSQLPSLTIPLTNIVQPTYLFHDDKKANK